MRVSFALTFVAGTFCLACASTPDSEATSPAPSQAEAPKPDYSTQVDEGRALLEAGKLQEAIRVFEEAESQAPERVEAPYGRLVARSSLCVQNSWNDCDRCIEVGRRVHQISPGYRHGYWNLGRCMSVLGHQREALELVQKGKLQHPDDPDYDVLLVLILIGMGNQEGACSVIERLPVTSRQSEDLRDIYQSCQRRTPPIEL